MNKLSIQARVQILNALSEGMGVNATARLTGTSKNTVLKLLADVGEACAAYQDRVMRGLRCARLECDEVWSFVGAKQKNTTADHPEGYGDCYTFTAIDPDTKLMPCWLVGVRTSDCTHDFMADLASRIAGRVQLTTDGYWPYLRAVEDAFHDRVDHAVLNKSYEGGPAATEAKRRYSPASFVKCTKEKACGNPNMALASTSIVERSNLSLRMGNRRFTRLTNAFSKKLENHMHAISFYFMVYNFVKIHKTIKTTPAMEAGVTDFLWSMEDIVLMSETNS
jgi:IS1 family transposase